jgi:hypothetical protein
MFRIKFEKKKWFLYPLLLLFLFLLFRELNALFPGA